MECRWFKNITQIPRLRNRGNEFRNSVSKSDEFSVCGRYQWTVAKPDQISEDEVSKK